MAHIEAIEKNNLMNAAIALMPLLSSPAPKDWPVLHVPMHANTFPLTYIYSLLLLLRVDEPPYNDIDFPAWWDRAITIQDYWKENVPDKEKKVIKDHILESKILCQDWGDDPPKLDYTSKFNLFFANKSQVERWCRLVGKIHLFMIFNYLHEFVLVDNENKSGSLVPIEDWDHWLNELSDETEIRIITDIEAQALLLHDFLQQKISTKNKRCAKINIVSSTNRTPRDVMHWTFVDKKGGKVKRVFLLGTPLCEILKYKRNDKSENVYTALEYKANVKTFFCIVPSQPSPGSLPAYPIYEFFKSLKYNVPYAAAHTSDGSFDNIATAFRQCIETNLPDIPGSFKEDFNRSISKHCKLALSMKLFSR